MVIRTHALIADLLGHDQMQRLADSESVPDFVEKLAETSYGRISLEGEERIPIALERIFYEKFLERVLKIVNLTPQKIGEFLQSYYYLRFEILNLKRILRGKYSGQPNEEIQESLVPIQPYLVRDYQPLIASNSVEAAVQLLKSTPYAPLISELAYYKEHEALWRLELALNHIFAKSIFKAVQALPSRDRRLVHRIVEFEADIENFLIAVKQRRGSGTADMNLAEMFPATYGIGLDKIKDVTDGKDLKTIIEGLNEDYSKVLSPIYGGDVALIRTRLRRYKYETANSARATNEFGFNVIMAYLVYSEIEKDNLVGLGWGKTQGLSSENLMKYVIIPKS